MVFLDFLLHPIPLHFRRVVHISLQSSSFFSVGANLVRWPVVEGLPPVCNSLRALVRTKSQKCNENHCFASILTRILLHEIPLHFRNMVYISLQP